MSRIQLALNVADIDAAVEFYSTLFDTAPAKRRPGYANFAVANPPLKLVLFENPEATGTLNHLGVERESMAEIEEQATASRPPGSRWTSRATSSAATPARTSTGSPARTDSAGRTTSCSPTPSPSWKARARPTSNRPPPPAAAAQARPTPRPQAPRVPSRPGRPSAAEPHRGRTRARSATGGPGPGRRPAPVRRRRRDRRWVGFPASVPSTSWARVVMSWSPTSRRSVRPRAGGAGVLEAPWRPLTFGYRARRHAAATCPGATRRQVALPRRALPATDLPHHLTARRLDLARHAGVPQIVRGQAHDPRASTRRVEDGSASC